MKKRNYINVAKLLQDPVKRIYLFMLIEDWKVIDCTHLGNNEYYVILEPTSASSNVLFPDKTGISLKPREEDD